jgi:hypothetical protein
LAKRKKPSRQGSLLARLMGPFVTKRLIVHLMARSNIWTCRLSQIEASLPKVFDKN